MSIFVAILIVSAILAIVRLSKKLEFEKKTVITLWELSILIILSGVQAVLVKNANISAAFWLLGAIFVVLLVNTSLTKRALDKNKKNADTENNGNAEEVNNKEVFEAKFEEVETPPAPPTI